LAIRVYVFRQKIVIEVYFFIIIIIDFGIGLLFIIYYNNKFILIVSGLIYDELSMHQSNNIN
jgi:hypothetical protein